MFNLLSAYLLLLIAIIFVSLGVYFSVSCNLIATPVESTVKTISQVYNLKFSLVKNVFDITMIIMMLLLCLVLQIPVYGIGMGTVLSVCWLVDLFRAINIFLMKKFRYIKRMF